MNKKSARAGGRSPEPSEESISVALVFGCGLRSRPATAALRRCRLLLVFVLVLRTGLRLILGALGCTCGRPRARLLRVVGTLRLFALNLLPLRLFALSLLPFELLLLRLLSLRLLALGLLLFRLLSL